MKHKKNGLFFFLLLWSSLNLPQADCIIFSYKRPLQLYATLETLATYVAGLGQISVLYRADSDAYQRAYMEVQEDFPEVEFVRQGDNPSLDFRPLLLEILDSGDSEYIMFAVDDDVVVDDIDLDKDCELLKKTCACGLYYRLGLNITWCYSHNKQSNPPPYTQIEDDIYQWQFNQGSFDWNYPYNVDMTLYEKKEILPLLEKLNYTNPNTLEARLAGQSRKIAHKKGLCHTTTKMFGIPLNLVQTTYNNRHMHSLSPEELLTKFDEGLKLDITPLDKMQNNAPHVDYTPTFVTR